MTIKRFAMTTNKGKGVIQYEAYLKNGVFQNLTKVGKGVKRVRYAQSYGKRLYDAHEEGVVDREVAIGKEPKPRAGRPRTVKHQIEKGKKYSKPLNLYYRVLYSIGAARGEYENGKWSYGGYKKAQAIYRDFRDEFSKNAWDNPNNQRIKPLHKCYSHSARRLYACVVVDKEISPKLDDDGKPMPQSKHLYITYLDVYYEDVCKEKYTFGQYEDMMHKLPAAIDWEAQNIGVEFVGLCGYNVRLD